MEIKILFKKNIIFNYKKFNQNKKADNLIPKNLSKINSDILIPILLPSLKLYFT